MGRDRKWWQEFPLPSGERRRTPDGRPLHCCSVCGRLAPWGKQWEWYGSHKDFEDGFPVFKSCSEKCKKVRKAVTAEMQAEARRKEYREEGAA